MLNIFADDSVSTQNPTEKVPEAQSVSKIISSQKEVTKICLEATWKLLEHVRGPVPIGTKEAPSAKCLIDDLLEQTEMLDALKSNLNELCAFMM